MRIGTWNLQGRWDQRHRDQVDRMGCDVLLLTEVPDDVDLPEMTVHRSRMPMAPCRSWAAVVSRRPSKALPDPHGASVLVEVDGLRVCASVLPWRSCGKHQPWVGSTTSEKTAAAVEAIERTVPAIWGGDWNHAMTGREYAGSKEGRRHIRGALERLSLQVPTTASPHQIEGLLSIDHVAVPARWTVLGVEHHAALTDGVRISDHDAYVVAVNR